MDKINYMEYLRDSNSRVMHVANYAYVIDLSAAHRVAYYAPGEPLHVYEAQVLCCRTPIDDIDRRFYVSASTVNILKLPDVFHHWGYMCLPWVEPDFAKFIKVIERKNKLFVFLSHVDLDVL